MRSTIRRWCVVLCMFTCTTPALAQVQRTEVNFGFEAPVAGATACNVIIADDQVPGWSTTHDVQPAVVNCPGFVASPTSGRLIEIWANGFNGIAPRAGNQIAELNAFASSRIYQDICLTNGETVQWRLSHRGRASASVPDVMDFGMNPVGDATTPVQARIARIGTTSSGLDRIDGGGTPSFADQGTIVVGATTNGWRDYSGAFVYSGATVVQQFGFAAVSSASGDSSLGNLLDDIQVTLTPYVELSSSTATANEGDTVTLSLHIMGTVPAGGISVPLSLSGSAASGSDFTMPASVAIPQGEYDDQFFTITVSIADDAVNEASESLIVSLGSSTPDYTIASTSTCGGAPIASETITIVDDDPMPSLTLVKSVVNDNGGTALANAWTLTASGPTTLGGASGINGAVPAGTYALSESGGPAGYVASTYSCVVNAGAPVVSNTIALVDHDVATCTITNDDVAASLSLTKNVVGGPGVATDWILSASGPMPLSGAGGVASTPVSAGTYTLSETGGVANTTYNASAWSCTGGALTGTTLVLANGESADCSITNTYAPANVSVSKVASAGPAHVGDTMTFTVTVSVATSMTSGDMTIIDTLGAGLDFGTVTNAGAFACSGALSCVLPGGTPPGIYTLTYTAIVNAAATSSVDNAIVALSPDDPACSPCATSTPVQPPGGTLVKTVVGPDPVRVGDVLTYTLTATVTGSQLIAPITLNDTLGTGLTLQQVTDPGIYQCTPSLGCTLPPGTPPGVYSITYTAIVNDQATGTVTNTVAPVVGPRAPSCVSCTTTTDVHLSDATIAKTSDAPAQVAIGTVITYTVTTTVAHSLTTDLITVTDTLGTGLTFGGVTNAGAYTCSGALTCTLPAGTVPGTYPLVYTATVNAQANGSVRNSVSAIGADVTGPSANVDTELVAPVVTLRKTADTAGPVATGDLITYTVDVTIAQASTTRLATFTDTLGAGLDFVAVTQQASAFTCNATNPLVCTLPIATPPGTYTVRYTARVNDTDTDSVTNSIVGTGVATTCDPCVVTLPAHLPTLRIAKQVAQSEVRVGDLVRYTLTVDNTGTVRATDARLIDTPPSGFTLVEGSLTTTDADNATQLTNTAPIQVDHIDIAPGARATITYLLRVGASARAGTHVNRAHMEISGANASATASAQVHIVADPIFDASTIVGTVFEDRNGNGEQDTSEPGIAGARIATVTGLLVETDRFGRYHVAAVEVHAGRGSNVLLKLDAASLPSGSAFTTPNPLLRRVTPGMPVRFDFGVKPGASR